MNDPVDWSVTSWDGNRRRQHQEYLALTFRQKLELLEQMTAFTAVRRAALDEKRATGEGGGQ